jgi:hypothetical protein
MSFRLGSTTRCPAGRWRAVALRVERGVELARLVGQALAIWRRLPNGWALCLGVSIVPVAAALRGWIRVRSRTGCSVLLAGSCLVLAAADATAQRSAEWDRDQPSSAWWQQQDLWSDRKGDADWPRDEGRDWRTPPSSRSAPRSWQEQDSYRFSDDTAPGELGSGGRGGSGYGGWHFREDPELDALTKPAARSGYRFRPPTERERHRWADGSPGGAESDYRWRPGSRPSLPYGEDDKTFGYSPVEGGAD